MGFADDNDGVVGYSVQMTEPKLTAALLESVLASPYKSQNSEKIRIFYAAYL